MARTIEIGAFQAMQRAESDTSGTVEQPSIAEQLQRLGVRSEVDAEMALGLVKELVRTAADEAGIPADYDAVSAEAERIWTSFGDERRGPRIATIDGTTGEVRDWRRPDTTPDRGPDVGETHHTITDGEPRFSGGGTRSEGERPMSRLIPQDIAFQKRQFKPAPELANLADKLIDEHGFLEQLEACDLEFKWQRLGTNSQGKRSIGAMKRVSGVWADYCSAQFVIYLAADTARLAKFTDRQVEAALFHQLLHIGRDKKGNWIKVGHDFEGFGTEVRHYGPWTEDLRIGGQAFTVAHQMGLFDQACDDDAEDEDEEDDGSGTLIHADGSPMTADEIAEMEAAEEHGEEDDDEDLLDGEIVDTDEITVVAGDEVGGPNDPVI